MIDADDLGAKAFGWALHQRGDNFRELGRSLEREDAGVAVPPGRWTLVHGAQPARGVLEFWGFPLMVAAGEVFRVDAEWLGRWPTGRVEVHHAGANAAHGIPILVQGVSSSGERVELSAPAAEPLILHLPAGTYRIGPRSHGIEGDAAEHVDVVAGRLCATIAL